MTRMLLFLICVSLLVVGGGIFVARNSFLRALPGSEQFLSKLLAAANPNIMLKGSEPANEVKNSGNAHGGAGGAPKKEHAASRKASTGVAAHANTHAADSQQPTTAVDMSMVAPVTANKTETKQSSAVHTEPLVCSSNSAKAFSRSVLINEVAWAGVASDKTAEEWIELKNNSGSKISLEGWQMQNGNESVKIFFAASDSVPAGGLYLLERGNSNFLQGVKADNFFAGAIKNNDEALRLFDKNCNVIDEIVADVGADKNWPAGTANPDYRTAERSSDLSWHSYNGTGANGVFGTPAAENSSAPVSASAASGASQSQTQLSLPSPSSPPPPAYFPFQFSKSGTGAGSVTSEPAGISCANSCVEDSEDFVSGTAVSLVAVAADNSEFAGWTGDCSGTGACSVSMTGAKSVSAVFNQAVSSAPPSAQTVPSFAKSNVNHVLISQVQITGGAGQTTNDFIELYNPSGEQFNLKGHRLVKRAKTSTSDTPIKSWTSDEFIPPYGFYLWANSDYGAIAVMPDATTTTDIADDNGIAVRFGPKDTGTIVDSVAWGGAQNI
ncbi:lamin tail domain-containing protein, partial [Patescibacteria group bacterium]|nr:lamin tail domain-containing protein [Patescibacteria group bacterium]